VSGFAERTPFLRIAFENHFFGKRYPAEGAVLAVVDTGYEGFVAVPTRVFEALSLDRLSPKRRSVRTADGRELVSTLSVSSVILPDQSTALDGEIETMAGLSEILVGTLFLSRFSLALDYCLGAASMHPC
jgi:clan AA aspartic protease